MRAAARGLWGPRTTGRGQHHLDRGLGVGLPGGIDHHRPGPRPGPDPAAHHLATHQQRGCGTALIGRPGALGDQRRGGHPDRRQPKHGAKVQGKAGAAGMVTSGGVDHQHLRDDRQGADGLLEQRAFPEGEQGRQVGPGGGPADTHPGQLAAAVGHRRAGEASVTGGTSTSPVERVRSKRSRRRSGTGSREAARVPGYLPEGVLQPDELVRGGRPGRHGR